MTRTLLAALVLMLFGAANAAFITTDALQVGGLYADGDTDNLPSHQNYYVGYGSGAPPFTRTAERRSFFWFHLPAIPPGMVVTSATLTLKMPFPESLVFGKGPGEPGPAVPLDASEIFALGATSFSKDAVTSPTLTPGEAMTIFDDFDAHPIAPTKTFLLDPPLGFPMVVDLPFDAVGTGYVASHLGADVVLTGWMPSWSHDERLAPGGGDWFEKHELLFGHSEILTGTVPKPVLTIEYVPVPEPATMAALGMGVVAILRRRRSH